MVTADLPAVSFTLRERIISAAWRSASVFVTVWGCVWIPAAAIVSSVMLLESIHVHRAMATVIEIKRMDPKRHQSDLFKVRIEGPDGTYSTVMTRFALGDRTTGGPTSGLSGIPIYCTRYPEVACFADPAEPGRWAGGFALSVPFAILVIFGYRRKSRRALDGILAVARRRRDG